MDEKDRMIWEADEELTRAYQCISELDNTIRDMLNGARPEHDPNGVETGYIVVAKECLERLAALIEQREPQD